MSQIQQSIAKEHPEWILPKVCQQNAYKTGIYSGIFMGILSVPISQRAGLDKNRMTLATMSVAIITGYFVSRFAYQSCITSEGFLSGMRHIDTSKSSADGREKELH